MEDYYDPDDLPCDVCGRPTERGFPWGFMLGWIGGLGMMLVMCILVNRYWPWN